MGETSPGLVLLQMFGAHSACAFPFLYRRALPYGCGWAGGSLSHLKLHKLMQKQHEAFWGLRTKVFQPQCSHSRTLYPELLQRLQLVRFLLHILGGTWRVQLHNPSAHGQWRTCEYLIDSQGVSGVKFGFCRSDLNCFLHIPGSSGNPREHVAAWPSGVIRQPPRGDFSSCV